MIKNDELAMMEYFYRTKKVVFADLIDTRGLHKYFILCKWVTKGYIDFGTSLDFVWLTEEGIKYFEKCGVTIDE